MANLWEGLRERFKAPDDAQRSQSAAERVGQMLAESKQPAAEKLAAIDRIKGTWTRDLLGGTRRDVAAAYAKGQVDEFNRNFISPRDRIDIAALREDVYAMAKQQLQVRAQNQTRGQGQSLGESQSVGLKV